MAREARDTIRRTPSKPLHLQNFTHIALVDETNYAKIVILNYSYDPTFAYSFCRAVSTLFVAVTGGVSNLRVFFGGDER